MKSSESKRDPSLPFTFRFRNLGPIRDATLELGDLTIIAGRNNTGKTYLAYTLYGFLKMWRRWPGPHDLFFGDEASAAFPHLEAAVKRLPREGHARFPLSLAELARQRTAVARRLSADFSEQAISQVFSSRPDDFADASFEVLGHPDEPMPDGSYTVGKARSMHELPGISIEIEYDRGHVTMTVDRAHTTLSTSELEYVVAERYAWFLLDDVLPEPFILSAERFGISLFYRELDFTKNQLVDLLQKISDDKTRERASPFLIIDRATSRYALPIKDNIDYTRSIPERRKGKSELHELELFDSIKDMMEGYYGAKGDEIRFISKSRGRGRSFNIPLHIASSSSRGLSDLYFYLRHVARAEHLLIIDEPESHLDTANQIRLARLLAQLVKAGLKVLITTHSDYLIKEINNLVMLSQPMPCKEEAIRKLKYHSSDWLPPESIRAYVAEKHNLNRCTVDRFGIDMPVFDETIGQINTAANDLMARLTEAE